jgi:hypothetical protein
VNKILLIFEVSSASSFTNTIERISILRVGLE